MRNARPTLKAVADGVTARGHDDDGVVHTLRLLEARGALLLPAPRAVGGSRAATVRRVAAADVVGLRERVLWPGRPDMCVLPEDEAETAVHLAATYDSADGDDAPSEAGDASDASGASRVVGVVSLFPSDRGTGARCQFRKLAVSPDEQGRRLGTALVETALAEARQAGASALFCHARLGQAGFYERLGFRSVDEPFEKYGGGEMYVEMQAAT